LAIGETRFDGDVLTLDVTAFFQARVECSDKWFVWRTPGEISDHRHRGLLRTRRERPHDRRTAEQRNELTPPHVFLSGRGSHPTTPPERLCITANSGG